MGTDPMVTEQSDPQLMSMTTLNKLIALPKDQNRYGSMIKIEQTNQRSDLDHIYQAEGSNASTEWKKHKNLSQLRYRASATKQTMKSSENFLVSAATALM